MKLSRAESGPAPWEDKLEMEIGNARACPCAQGCDYRDWCRVSGLMCERYLLYLYSGRSRRTYHTAPSPFPSPQTVKEYERMAKMDK